MNDIKEILECIDDNSDFSDIEKIIDLYMPRPSDDQLEIETKAGFLQKILRSLQISHLPSPVIAEIIGKIVDLVISSEECSIFNHMSKVKIQSFSESVCPWRLFFIQSLLTLTGSCLLNKVRNLEITSNSSSRICWDALLSLISVVTICSKGGVDLIKDFLHEILISLFSLGDKNGCSFSSLDNCDSDESSEDTSDPPNSQLETNDQRFICAILIARQLFSEDVRVVGSSYQQWLQEKFSSPPFNISPTGRGVLSSRRSVEYIAKQFTLILPYEIQPIYLRAQISLTPYWLQIGHSTYASEVNTKENLCPWHEDWFEYVDIGRGRLAELKTGLEECEPSKNDGGFDFDPLLVKHWKEVLDLLEEFSVANSQNLLQSLKCRPPAALMELLLFRSQHLRENLLPLLREPPKCFTLKESLQITSHQMLAVIENQLHTNQLNFRKRKLKSKKLTKN